jgi:PAS domain S-box-containing protein
MCKQYPLIRALRYAAIALFLAAGFEGLRQVVFPKLSAGQSRLAATLPCAVVVFVLNLGLLYREKAQQNKLSENIIGSLPEIASVSDETGRLNQWNSNFDSALGYTAQNFAKIKAVDAIAEEQRETVKQTIATTLSNGMAKVESVLMSKDGTRIRCLLTGVRPILNDEPCVLGIAVKPRTLRQVEESLRVSEERQMGQPINHCNLKCTMTEGSVDTIVSAIYLMMEGPSKNAGLDFAEVVRQFLCDLTIPEQTQFWAELKTLYPQTWLRNLTTINFSDIASLTEQVDSKAAKAGSIQ